MTGSWLALLLLLLAGGGIGLAMVHDQGMVMISWDGWMMQASIWTTLLLLLLLWFLSDLLLVGLHSLLHIPERWRMWRHRCQLRGYQKSLDQAQSLLLLGRFGRAEKIFLRAARTSEDPLSAWLGASRAAERAGVFDRAMRHLDSALGHNDRYRAVILLMQSRLLARQGLEDAALAKARLLYPEVSREPEVVLWLMELLQRCAQWGALAELLARERALAHPDWQERERLAHLHVIGHMAEQATVINQTHIVEQIASYVQTLAKSMREHPKFRTVLASIWLKLDQHERAETLLTALLRLKQPPAEAIRLVGQLKVDKEAPVQKLLEHMMDRFPANVELLHALAGRALYLGDRGKARTYLESALSFRADPRIQADLIELLQSEGMNHQAQHLMIHALRQLRA